MSHFFGNDCPGGHMDEEVAFKALTPAVMDGDHARALISRLKGNTLGPWQAGFDAWTLLADKIRNRPPDHFQTTLLVQIIEVREQLARGDWMHAAKEMNDIISVALNWMRSLGLNDEDIARIATIRAATRYEGQVVDIMDTYQKKYDI